MNSVRLRRLKSDYEAIRRLVRMHPRIEIEGVSGSPPDRYIFQMNVRSLRERGDEIEDQSLHRIEVKLPLGYPRDAPHCRMLTPVFHPNIAPHTICIGDHWSASESLDLMIQRVGEMLAFQSYNIKSPLNGRAAQWVDENQHRIPTDAAEFFIDLSAAPPPQHESAGGAPDPCANCGEPAVVTCNANHGLCTDDLIRCPTCDKLLCLVCGEARCLDCTRPCANCGETAVEQCQVGHFLCADGVVRCTTCSALRCLLGAEPGCRTCRAAAR